jgi:hypothetical protein
VSKRLASHLPPPRIRTIRSIGLAASTVALRVTTLPPPFSSTHHVTDATVRFPILAWPAIEFASRV